MKPINQGFLERVLPVDHIKYAFKLKHINRYKYYYSVIV